MHLHLSPLFRDKGNIIQERSLGRKKWLGANLCSSNQGWCRGDKVTPISLNCQSWCLTPFQITNWTQTYWKHLNKRCVLWLFSLAHVPSGKMAGFITYTAANHRVGDQYIWGGNHVVHLYIQSMVWSFFNGTNWKIYSTGCSWSSTAGV